MNYANQLPGLPTLEQGAEQRRMQQAPAMDADAWRRQALARQLLGQDIGGPIDSFGEMGGSLFGSGVDAYQGFRENRAQKALGSNLPGIQAGKVGGLF